MWAKCQEIAIGLLMRRSKKWIRILSNGKKKKCIMMKLDCNSMYSSILIMQINLRSIHY